MKKISVLFLKNISGGVYFSSTARVSFQKCLENGQEMRVWRAFSDLDGVGISFFRSIINFLAVK